MARRLAITSAGLVISYPGVDALAPGADSNLLFSMARKNLMQIGAGSFTLSSGMRINFGVTTPDVPLVFCQALAQSPIRPCHWVADTTGFNVYATGRPQGDYPAEGNAIYWAAFMRSQG